MTVKEKVGEAYDTVKEKVTDVYEDENSKSITTRITFADPEKTLTREEVQGVSDSIVAELKANGIELKG